MSFRLHFSNLVALAALSLIFSSGCGDSSDFDAELDAFDYEYDDFDEIEVGEIPGSNKVVSDGSGIDADDENELDQLGVENVPGSGEVVSDGSGIDTEDKNDEYEPVRAEDRTGDSVADGQESLQLETPRPGPQRSVNDGTGSANPE